MIQFFNAGAGSGKTYTLANELARYLVAENGDPSQVILTTFSNKSADELKERVRKQLLEKGEFEKAQAMANAAIGTVNAVCSRFVEQFALETGISPQLRVLDEKGTDRFFDEFVQVAIDQDQILELEKLSARFSLFAAQDGSYRKSKFKTIWHQYAKELAARFRAYRFDRAAVERSREASKSHALELLNTKPGFSIADIWNYLEACVERPLEGTPTQKDLQNLEALKELQQRSSIKDFREYDMFSGMSASPGVKFGKLNPWYTEICAQVSQYHRTEDFRDDYTRLIHMLYDTAFQMIDAYQRYKSERGLIDFSDQEILFLDMLRDNKIVQQEIKNTFRLVMVDEFQDSSPVQLAIFSELSALVKDSTWVGDPKQSIYGFRDSDSQLFDLAMQSVHKDAKNKKHNLGTNYRSRPGLVYAVNEIFKGFFGDLLQEDQIVLQPSAIAVKQEKQHLFPPLEILDFPKMRNDAKFGAVGVYIKELLASGRKIYDKELAAFREIRGSDIAVLFRSNAHLAEAAEMFDALGIRVAAPSSGMCWRAEVLWITSLLRLRINPRDSLAVANLLLLEGAVENVEALIRLRLKHFADENRAAGAWGESSTTAKKVIEQEAALDQMPLSLAITHLISATGLPAYCSRWGREGQRMAVVNHVIALAAEYEQQSAISGIAAGSQGFLNYLLEYDDVPADNGADAVVLTTVHKSKGLEWPVVIAMNKRLGSGADRVLFNNIHVLHPGNLSLKNLLKGQQVLFFPWPFAAKRTLGNISLDIATNATELDRTIGATKRNRKEEDRLLYVALTRARDYLVLPTFNGETCCEIESDDRGGSTGFLHAKEIEEWRSFPDQQRHHQHPAGITACMIKRIAFDALAGNQPGTNKPGVNDPTSVEIYRTTLPGDKIFEPKYVMPSSLTAHPQGTKIKPGARSRSEITIASLDFQQKLLKLNSLKADQYTSMGNCLHHCMASWNQEQVPKRRQEKITAIIEGFGMSGYLSAAEIDNRSAAFFDYLDKSFGAGDLFRELPLTTICGKSGRVTSGIADLVLQTDQGLVLIDHKSFPGDFNSMAMNPDNEFYAGKYFPQLDAYTQMLSSGYQQPVAKMLIHYVVQGRIVELNG